MSQKIFEKHAESGRLTLKSKQAKVEVFPHLEAWVQFTKSLLMVCHGLVIPRKKCHEEQIFSILLCSTCWTRTRPSSSVQIRPKVQNSIGVDSCSKVRTNSSFPTILTRPLPPRCTYTYVHRWLGSGSGSSSTIDKQTCVQRGKKEKREKAPARPRSRRRVRLWIRGQVTDDRRDRRVKAQLSMRRSLTNA
jgi:hypothetical protein